MNEARKLSFQEAWDSSVVFFMDEQLENAIEAEVESLLVTAGDSRVSDGAMITVDSISDFVVQKKDGLAVILKDIGLSEEKFMRMVSLLRKLGRIPGGFDTEWGLNKIINKMMTESDFAHVVAKLLVDGKRDEQLQQYIPRYYLDTLNYREIKGSSEAARRTRYKSSLIGTYGGKKGHRVEGKIEESLSEIEAKYGVSYGKGRSRMIETDIDFAIPSVEDPWKIGRAS